MNLFNLLLFLPKYLGIVGTQQFFFIKISQLNKLPRISDLPIDGIMLNPQTTSKNSPIPDQTEDAIWLYAGIAAAMLVGGMIVFLGAKIVACYFCKGTNSQAKSHQPSYVRKKIKIRMGGSERNLTGRSLNKNKKEKKIK